MNEINEDRIQALPLDVNVIFVVPLTTSGAVKQLLNANFDNAPDFVIAPWHSFETQNFMQLRNC